MKRLLLALLLVASAAQAELSRFEYTGHLSFDPNRVISAGGGTLGALMAEIFGPSAASGQAVVTGRMAYQTDTPAAAKNAVIAGYPTALQSSQIDLGAVTVALDLAQVRANAASSQIGLVAFPNGGFCVDSEHCVPLGVRNAPWGMAGIALNGSRSFLHDETGTSDLNVDVFGFLMGRTAAPGEFAPALQTSGFGVVSVHGLSWGLFGLPGSDFLTSLTLPPMTQFEGTTQIGRTELWLEFEGGTLLQTIRVEGVISAVNVLK
ncbi:hypothetical protein E4Z66_16150 [Aliishimia ponticola]|uniref:Uncharacterized protein n=1 Tax=Aliishimia ponticola TaxID=2499833 RepID=A0A4S4NA88_9RHOB|nr:hypothetical protein [Aliishimia ponticola]THH35347.1 hypothetical protein E4Z66_16150 [Aliishimia ponticola]